MERGPLQPVPRDVIAPTVSLLPPGVQEDTVNFGATVSVRSPAEGPLRRPSIDAGKVVVLVGSVLGCLIVWALLAWLAYALAG